MPDDKDICKDSEVRIHTRISIATKTKWEIFLLEQHDTVRGAYGPELEAALNQYMDDCSPPKADKSTVSGSTFETLKLIATAFKILPAYPLVMPLIIKSVIRDNTSYSDRRTITKYRRLVQIHSKKVEVPGEVFPKLDVTGFCNYIERLENEPLVK